MAVAFDEVKFVLAALMSAEPKTAQKALYALNAACEIYFNKLGKDGSEDAVVRAREAREILIEVETESGGPQSHCVLVAAWADSTERKIREKQASTASVSRVATGHALQVTEHRQCMNAVRSVFESTLRARVAIPARSKLRIADLLALRKLLMAGRDFASWQLVRGLSELTAPNNSDWFTVSESMVDRTDPDCVTRAVAEDMSSGVSEHLQMWSPVRWVALAVSLLIPMRPSEIRLMSYKKTDGSISFGSKMPAQLRDAEFPFHLDSIQGPQWRLALSLLEKLRDWQVRYNPPTWHPSVPDVDCRGKQNILPLATDEIFLFRTQGSGRFTPSSAIALGEILRSWRQLLGAYTAADSSGNIESETSAFSRKRKRRERAPTFRLSEVSDVMLRAELYDFRAVRYGRCMLAPY